MVNIYVYRQKVLYSSPTDGIGNNITMTVPETMDIQRHYPNKRLILPINDPAIPRTATNIPTAQLTHFHIFTTKKHNSHQSINFNDRAEYANSSFRTTGREMTLYTHEIQNLNPLLQNADRPINTLLLCIRDPMVKRRNV
ncbi:Hypothetical predicted protein [Pelobates cultripes]|uniref:Uncharacterized protein n=1 Tax=Pelobates cultripes TaxID=61616 RepID=A0AAD1VUY7_PELCU|nr:Hypothetical predicted protein [Pelobates cultripes]